MATNPVENEIEARYNHDCDCGYSGDMEGYKQHVAIAYGGGQIFYVTCPDCNAEYEIHHEDN